MQEFNLRATLNAYVHGTFMTKDGGNADTVDNKHASDFATASQGSKADTAIQSETDPTVPSWAKTATKPTYTASEVGAYSKDEIDATLEEYSKTAEQNVQADWSQSDATADSYIKNKPTTMTADGGNADTLNNKQASDFATSSQGSKADTAIQSETDPTVPSWAKATSKPSYTASETGAYSKSEVDNLLSGFTGGGGGSANALGPVKAGECWTPIFESGLLVRCVYFYTGDVDPGTITIPADIHGGAEEYFDYPIPFCIAALSLNLDRYATYSVNDENALKISNNTVLEIYAELGVSEILNEADANTWTEIKEMAINAYVSFMTAKITNTLTKIPFADEDGWSVV
jgi:hypothetical protein